MTELLKLAIDKENQVAYLDGDVYGSAEEERNT